MIQFITEPYKSLKKNNLTFSRNQRERNCMDVLGSCSILCTHRCLIHKTSNIITDILRARQLLTIMLTLMIAFIFHYPISILAVSMMRLRAQMKCETPVGHVATTTLTTLTLPPPLPPLPHRRCVKDINVAAALMVVVGSDRCSRQNRQRAPGHVMRRACHCYAAVPYCLLLFFIVVARSDEFLVLPDTHKFVGLSKMYHP